MALRSRGQRRLITRVIAFTSKANVSAFSSSWLRGEKQALEEALAEIGAECEEEDELSKQLARVPDLTKALREATPDVQRQVFEAFKLEILYDKAGRRIEISATVSEAVASAFEDRKALPKEGSRVLLTEVAGARFVPRYHHPRIRETRLHLS